MVSVFASEKGDPRRLFSINIGTDSRKLIELFMLQVLYVQWCGRKPNCVLENVHTNVGAFTGSEFQ